LFGRSQWSSQPLSRSGNIRSMASWLDDHEFLIGENVGRKTLNWWGLPTPNPLLVMRKFFKFDSNTMYAIGMIRPRKEVEIGCFTTAMSRFFLVKAQV
jgi:hypothetical protein